MMFMKTLLRPFLFLLFAFSTAICPASECCETDSYLKSDADHACDDKAMWTWADKLSEAQNTQQLQVLLNTEEWQELELSQQITIFHLFCGITSHADIIQAGIDDRLSLPLSPESLAAANKELSDNPGEYYSTSWLYYILSNEELSVGQRLDFAQQIVSKGGKVDSYTLEVCCHQGEKELIAFCLNHGASLQNAHMGWLTPIEDEAKLRDCFAYLLEQGVAVNGMNEYGHSPVLEAALFNNILFNLLMENGLNIHQKDEEGDPPIVAMAHRVSVGEDNELTYLEMLLQAGADINARGWNAQTPLIAAASCNNIENMRLLLDKGAALELRDDDGHSALTAACVQGRIEAAELLIAKGADIRTKDGIGYTLLHNIITFDAVYSETDADAEDSHGRYLKLFTMLLEQGMDVDTLDSDHSTPLMIACICGNKGFITYLLEKGANPRYSDDGFSMLHAAAMGALCEWDGEVFSIIYEKQSLGGIAAFWLSIVPLLLCIASPFLVLFILVARALYKKLSTPKPTQA